MYTGNSIVDYLKSVGQSSDYASRATLAQSNGITGYTGTAQQNTQLLNAIKGSTPAPVPAPTATPTGAVKPAVQNTAVPTTAPAGSQITPAGQPQSIQDLINMGFTGYQGWNDNASALADFKATGGAGKGSPNAGGGAGAGLSMPTNNTGFNLPDLYEGLYKSSGISEIEANLSNKTKSFNDAQSKINDNPYLSEATRVGRIQKLKTDFNADTQSLQNDIAMKKADVETKLNLQTKQFDINNQMAKQALDQFNMLLSSGALSNLSGEEIANFTRSTGLSSSVIQSAINATKAKDVKTSIYTFTSDSGEVTAVVLNSNTGVVISTTSLGLIGNADNTPKATAGDKKAELQSQFVSALEGAKNSYGHVTPQDWQGAIASWISRGGTRKDFVELFGNYADPNRGDFAEAYGFEQP